jgi:TolB-like protein/Flp pilus assembly protein TadD
VLPFDNLNAESSSQYFADGIAEEVLNLLARIPQLRVISRSSSFALKQQNVTIPEVAKKLRVTYVLTGSVRKEGRLVRVRAQLVDAFSDTQLWSEIYERRVKDIFQVQNDIALAVAAAMKLTLVGGPPRSEVTSAEAYELFLQGVYFINKRSTDNYSRAVDYLERSVALDPEYSPAWSAIASTYAILARIGSIDYDDGFRRAREADEKALGLDQGNVLAHSVRAWIAMIYEREYALAAFHFRRAMALQPNNTTVLANSATLAANLGRLQRAIELNQRALAMDPTLAVVYTNLSIQFRALGRLDDAERAARKALELNPDMYSAPGNLAIISLLRGEPAVALAQVDTIKLQNLKQVVLSLAHHGLGNSDESNRILESFIAEHANRWAYDIACVYAWRGESDTAFRWLRRAIDQGQDVGGIKTQPLLAGLHRDPRWDQLLGQLGLADAQVATIEI